MYLSKGGQFTISDDCHSVEQIGANYGQLLEFAEETGIETWNYLKTGPFSDDARSFNIQFSSIRIDEAKVHQFFKEVPLAVDLQRDILVPSS